MEVGSVKQLPPSVVTRLTPAEVGRPAVKEADERSAEDMQASLRPEAESREASRSQVEGAVSAIQEFVQSVRRNLDFRVDDSSGRVVVQVTDRESGDVIRQMPTEEALKLAESLDEVRSLLFKAEA